MPVGADIITTERCNLRCFYCKKYLGRPRDMTLETFELISSKLFQNLLYVKFGSAGEHFLNRHFNEMLQICDDYKVDIFITSNGMLVDKNWAEKLILHRVKKVGISLDGATEITAESIRIGLDFKKVLNNIQNIVRLKKEYKTEYPKLSITYAAMRRNIEELPEFIELAKNLGIDFIRVQHMYVHDFVDKNESLFFYPSLTDKMFQLAKRKAKKMNIELWLPGSTNKSKKLNKKSFCHYPWKEIAIAPDGRVNFCCGAWDYKALGNIIEEDFKDIWNNNTYQQLRRTVNSNKPIFTLCEHCTVLQRDPSDIRLYMDKVHCEKS